jgi:hypothetical protein
MLMRSLCTGLLALLAWLPVGYAQSRVLRGNPREPALAATSALDVAADSPSRVGSTNNVGPRTLPPRHPGKVRAGDDGAGAVESVFGLDANAMRPNTGRPSRRQPLLLRAKRLTIPHDATAPPRQQS